MQGPQQFTDDSSTALGLTHRAYSDVHDEHRQAERDAYLQEIGVKELSKHLVQRYLDGGLSQEEAERCAVEEFLSRRPPSSSDGSLERAMQKYIDAGYTTLAAIGAAEAEISEESAGDVERDILGDSVEALMKAPVEVKGGGTKSRKHSSGCSPDPLASESLRHFRMGVM